MKTERIIWGLIFVFIGGILLLNNFGIIDFYWGSLWRFWPIIFILIGANMLFSHFNNTISTLLVAVITSAVLAFIGYQGMQPHNKHWGWFHHDRANNWDQEDKTSWPATKFTEAFVANTRKAELNIKGGATSYKLVDTTLNLFDAEVKQHYGNYILEKKTRDSIEVLTFRMRDKKSKWNMDNFDGNEAIISLNSNPVWNINVEMGAGEANFDLTAFKVETIRLKGGAASFNVKLGEPKTITNMFVDTGVAEVDIEIPSSAGCRIIVDSGLSSKGFKGFVKQPDGTYTTNNFNSATKKILISLKGGLSQFEVGRY